MTPSHCPFCRSPSCGRIGGALPACEGPGAPTAAFISNEDALTAGEVAPPFSGMEHSELKHITRLVFEKFGERAILYCEPADPGLIHVAIFRCHHTMTQHKQSQSGGLRCAQQVVAMGRSFNTLKAAIAAAVEHLQ